MSGELLAAAADRETEDKALELGDEIAKLLCGYPHAIGLIALAAVAGNTTAGMEKLDLERRSDLLAEVGWLAGAYFRAASGQTDARERELKVASKRH